MNNTNNQQWETRLEQILGNVPKGLLRSHLQKLVRSEKQKSFNLGREDERTRIRTEAKKRVEQFGAVLGGMPGLIKAVAWYRLEGLFEPNKGNKI